MTRDRAGADRASVTVDTKLRVAALDVLRDALLWRLTEARWGAVAEAVGALAASLRSRDVAAVRNAVYDLELVGPLRATGIGDDCTVPAPEPVLEEINELIHTVDGHSDDAQE